MKFRIETDREDDGRWIADIPALPGVMCYGETRERATARVTALALQVIADRIEHGEMAETPDTFVFEAA
ncbi:MAG: type II toxin-antitoxin system HicB family antitoxin [Fimbriimonadales bacterium]